MSFFSDLFEGNWSNLGTDITHAPSSLINHPDELLETGAAALAIAAPFALPEIGAALGGGAALEGGLGAAEAGGLAADLGIGDIGAGLGAADLGAAAAEGGLAADLGLADIGGAAAGLGDLNAAFGAFSPELGGAEFAGDLGAAGGDFAAGGADIGGAGGAGFDVGDVGGELGAGPTESAPGASPAAASGAGAAPSGAGATSTPAGFASTDAELSGGITGAGTAAPATSGGGFSSLVQGAGGWGNIAKWGLAATPLALTLAMGQGGLPPSAAALQQQANALSVQGQQDLAAARAGTLNAGQTAQIAGVKQDLENKWRQTLYNQGVTDITKDARWPQIEATIDAEVTKETAALIQQNITNALAETGQASTALTAIAQMQLTQDQNFTNNLINATKSLGLAAGLSSVPKISIG
jgi:hypothetical protein